MSFIDKAKNTAEKVAGEVKEAVGKATDDKDLQAEGKKDQAKGSLKNTGEDIKDAFKK
ncbi:MAG: CsbD family protein [Aeromicrobium erythreum]